MADWRKLAIIAGGGDLPVALAEHCAASGQDYFVARIAGYADRALDAHPGATHGLGAMGARIEAMREAGCDAVVLLGQVARPDFTAIALDDVARLMLPALAASMGRGDDALLRAVLREHENRGFQVLGAETVMGDLLAAPGAWGALTPDPGHRSDIALAARVANATGAFDVGQGVVVCDALVLAVEAQEGTDAMLRRVRDLPATVRGAPNARRGVLLKRPKPIQERRIDLPTIGIRTVEGADAAGLAGIAVEAGGALVVRKPALVAAADAAGLFLYGFTRGDVGEA